jgi:putative transposase
MENQLKVSLSNAVFFLRLQVVFVTRYRRKTLTPDLLAYLKESFAEILADWRCQLIEFGGEEDHVHLLIDIHPAIQISTLINSLKTSSARRARNRFAEHLARFYSKPQFWHRAYYVASVGNATFDAVRRYVNSQSTREKLRKTKCPRLD